MGKTAITRGIEVGERGRVTLSEDIRRQLNISEGDVLLPEITEEGTLELVPVALIPRDQVWFAHPEMGARIAEAHDDIAAGRTTTITSPDAMDAHLSQLEQEGRDD